MGAETLVVAGAAVAGALILIAARRRATPARPGLFAREEQEHARDQLERLLADIQELSREHIARLDSKIRTLQQLLAEADAKIRELRPAAPRPANPLHDRVYGLADAGRPVPDICSETGLDQGEVELILGLRHVQPR